MSFGKEGNKMKTVKAKMLLGIVVLVCLLVVGCLKSVSPETGETLHSLDPNTVENLQEMGEAGSMILGILSMFWPVLLPIAGYVGGAIRISKKLTPKLIEAQTETQMFHTIASSTILGIEEFKKEYPKEWKELEAELDAFKNKVVKPEDQLNIENLIRGLRGLPPKV